MSNLLSRFLKRLLGVCKMTDGEKNITEILEKLDATTKELETLKASLQAKDSEIETLKTTISERDTNISKLQKIVSDNLIASRDAPKNNIESEKSFNEIYADAIKNNLKEKK